MSEILEKSTSDRAWVAAQRALTDVDRAEMQALDTESIVQFRDEVQSVIALGKWEIEKAAGGVDLAGLLKAASEYDQAQAGTAEQVERARIEYEKALAAYEEKQVKVEGKHSCKPMIDAISVAMEKRKAEREAMGQGPQNVVPMGTKPEPEQPPIEPSKTTDKSKWWE